MQGETSLAIAADHPAFAGHFPGSPILPGVVLLDAVVQALTAQWPASPDGGASQVCKISSAKFLSPVRPGETLTIRYSTPASGSTHFEISGDDRKVAEGTLLLSTGP